MAYQNVGTPRFYINIPEWLSSNGVTSFSTQFNTLPIKHDESIYDLYTGLQDNSAPSVTENNSYPCFTALLDHSLKDYKFLVSDVGEYNEIFNWTHDTVFAFNGFSIISHQSLPSSVSHTFSVFDAPDPYIGSIVIGVIYDMPHSADIKLTMERKMDGVKRARTKGGHDHAGYKYIKPPSWNFMSPWEVTPPNPALGYLPPETSRIGRRIWNLSFSYLQDSDMFPMFSSIGPYQSNHADGTANWSEDDTWHQDNTLIDSNNFYSQVIHKTNGGQLPFIFQPDKNNNSSDGFAIAKFDQNSFKFSQQSSNLYRVSLKIREVW